MLEEEKTNRSDHMHHTSTNSLINGFFFRLNNSLINVDFKWVLVKITGKVFYPCIRNLDLNPAYTKN